MEVKISERKESLDLKKQGLELIEEEIQITNKLIEELKEIVNTISDEEPKSTLVNRTRVQLEIVQLSRKVVDLTVEQKAKKNFLEVLAKKMQMDEMEHDSKLALANKDFPKLIVMATGLVGNKNLPSHHQEKLRTLLADIKRGFARDEDKVKAFSKLQNDIQAATDHLKKINNHN